MFKKHCKICGKESNLISRTLGVCADCINQTPDEALPYIKKAHWGVRNPYRLPPQPPKDLEGIQCNICANKCKIGEGKKGFCGLRENIDGKPSSLVSPKEALLYMYLDPQVTNCCAAWFCPAGTGEGYPRYAYKANPEYGYYNLAVFFYGCNFNCLFCQNASHKNLSHSRFVSLEEILEKVTFDKISCICYFGGSPEPQLPFAIEASIRVIEDNPKRILRICFEWNGCGNRELVKRAAELALMSGGNLKFDLKCFSPPMSLALSGVSNQRAYENFRMIAEDFFKERKDIPILTATTLLVPGYVDHREVESIAKFISDLNKEIPYSLLAFFPHFMMKDLPVTPKKQIMECYRVAKKYLNRVTVGNLDLIGVKRHEIK